MLLLDTHALLWLMEDAPPNDPADRIIMATSLRLSARLVTADRAILGWQGELACIDARK